MIKRPPFEDFKEVFLDATERANQTPEQFVEKFLSSVKKMLLKDRLRYRGYGPYWWLIKKEFIDRNDMSFGDRLDAEYIEALDYGKSERNIIIAYAYGDVRFESGLMYDPYHTLLDTADNEVEFCSDDNDMEIS